MLNHVFVSAPAGRSLATAPSITLVVPRSSFDQKELLIKARTLILNSNITEIRQRRVMCVALPPSFLYLVLYVEGVQLFFYMVLSRDQNVSPFHLVLLMIEIKPPRPSEPNGEAKLSDICYSATGLSSALNRSVVTMELGLGAISFPSSYDDCCSCDV